MLSTMLSVITGVGLLFSAFPELVSSSGSGHAGMASISVFGIRMIKGINDYRILDPAELPSRHLADARSERSESVVLVLGPGGTLYEIDFSNATSGPVKKLFQRYNHAQNNLNTNRYGGSRGNPSKGEVLDGNLGPFVSAPHYQQWGPTSYVILDSIPTNTVVADSLSEL